MDSFKIRVLSKMEYSRKTWTALYIWVCKNIVKNEDILTNTLIVVVKFQKVLFKFSRIIND